MDKCRVTGGSTLRPPACETAVTSHKARFMHAKRAGWRVLGGLVLVAFLGAALACALTLEAPAAATFAALISIAGGCLVLSAALVGAVAAFGQIEAAKEQRLAAHDQAEAAKEQRLAARDEKEAAKEHLEAARIIAAAAPIQRETAQLNLEAELSKLNGRRRKSPRQRTDSLSPPRIPPKAHKARANGGANAGPSRHRH